MSLQLGRGIQHLAVTAHLAHRYLWDRQGYLISSFLNLLARMAGQNAAVDIGRGALRQGVVGMAGLQPRRHAGGAQSRSC